MKMNTKFLAKVITIVLIISSSAGLLSAQTDTTFSPASLNGHKFIINSTIGSPFTNTTYKNLLGAGQTIDLKIPDIVIKGVTVAQIEGENAYMNLAFEYQQELRDWLAFYGEVKLTGRLGTEPGTLISQGVNVVSGFNMGWKFKLLQSEKLIVSSDLNISKKSFTIIDLPKFIQGIIDSGKVTPGNKLVNFTPLVRGGINLRGAYAFNKTFGAIAKFYVDYGESAQRNEGDVFNYSYGLAVDVDLYPKHNVPLGFLLGFCHSSVPETKEQISRGPNELLFQINYTGKKYLNIGAEINYWSYKPDRFESYVNFLMFNLNSSIYF